MGKGKSQTAGKVAATVLDVSDPSELWQSRSNMVPVQTSKGTKVALLIGVSEYGQGFPQIPGAVKDVEAMQHILVSPELGDFDQVTPLVSPDAQKMKRAIEALFTGRTKDDLVLLFFSGHGFKDSSNKLYLGSRTSHKNSQGELLQSSAVSASYIYDVMNSCPSKRQIVILDCCFSGAFPEGMLAKDDSSVDIRTQLGGEGRVVLSSSSSTQLSFGEQAAGLSPYTRCLVEGIYTGEADLDRDHLISINELHQYVKNKIQERFSTLKPEIYAEKEGLRIMISKAKRDSEICSLSMNSFIKNEDTRMEDILSQNLTRRLIFICQISLLLLFISVIIVYSGIRFGCQYLHEGWLSGGTDNAWMRTRYNTENDKSAPEKKICESINIPIDRASR